MDTQNGRMKVVYTVVERAPGKSFWTRVGVGYANRDGSLNLRLDAIPINGTLQVREWEPMERRSDSEERGAVGHADAPFGGGGPGRSRGAPKQDPLADPMI